MIFLVTYELNDKRDYSPLFNALKGYDSWWHYIDSTWLVSARDQTAFSISNTLNNLIDQNQDNLLVTKVDLRERGGWLPKKAWEWIQSNS